jgi:hypothetical protein
MPGPIAQRPWTIISAAEPGNLPAEAAILIIENEFITL